MIRQSVGHACHAHFLTSPSSMLIVQDCVVSPGEVLLSPHNHRGGLKVATQSQGRFCRCHAMTGIGGGSCQSEGAVLKTGEVSPSMSLTCMLIAQGGPEIEHASVAG